MQFREGARLDGSQMGSGGGGRRKTVALGGGVTLIVLVVALFLGVEPSTLLGTLQSGQAPQTASSSGAWAQCEEIADISSSPECRWVAYTNSIQGYWEGAIEGYRVTQTVPFDDSISTGCGMATSAVGPFYCPADEKVYLDTDFFTQMLSGQLGARGGLAAEAYVIAHEYGHHISNQIGTMETVQQAGNQTGPTSPQVRLELQADCFAGAWFANASADPESPIEAITSEDLDIAVDAALAVGDDRVQEVSTGTVDRESWTHGSSAQRKAWLLKGFKSANPAACDTFAAEALN